MPTEQGPTDAPTAATDKKREKKTASIFGIAIPKIGSSAGADDKDTMIPSNPDGLIPAAVDRPTAVPDAAPAAKDDAPKTEIWGGDGADEKDRPTSVPTGAGAPADAPPTQDDRAPKTKIWGGSAAETSARPTNTVIAPAPQKGQGPKTKIWGGGASKQTAAADNAAAEDPMEDPMADPAVAMLVIIDGPGKGRLLKLGIGLNSIGDENQRVPLNFGDGKIARGSHAALAYDPKGKTFYIQPSADAHTVHVNEVSVSSPVQLEAMDRITLGGTTLLFTPICGEDFDWGE